MCANPPRAAVAQTRSCWIKLWDFVGSTSNWLPSLKEKTIVTSTPFKKNFDSIFTTDAMTSGLDSSCRCLSKCFFSRMQTTVSEAGHSNPVARIEDESADACQCIWPQSRHLEWQHGQRKSLQCNSGARH